MGAELIYKTTNEYVIELWEDLLKKVEAVKVKRDEYIAKMTEEFGPSPKNRYSYRDKTMDDVRQLIVAGPRVAGLNCWPNEEPPAGSGWRLDSKDRYWYPKLKEAKGKERRAELHALRGVGVNDAAKQFGLPDMIWGTGYIFYPGFTFDKDTRTLYLTWGSFECNKEMEEFLAKNPDQGWTEVPRSEWYAYVESREAQEKSGA